MSRRHVSKELLLKNRVVVDPNPDYHIVGRRWQIGNTKAPTVSFGGFLNDITRPIVKKEKEKSIYD